MEPKVEEVGRLFIVDPNPPGSSGLEQIPPEDLFIYVKFTATPRTRLSFEGQENLGAGGVTDEINFITSEIRYSPDGKLDPQQQETFATTNWTGIGGESSSGGVLEGFGIKSIDIKYNASLVPVVDITFTDVRGAGLFDTIKDNDRQSPYSIFFKMPYPIFKLSVKGYFGQSVEYCLHMVNWNSNFDGSTGNFDITANFLGFQQAFLNDMNIGNVIANVNTEEGRTQLDSLNWTYKDKAGNDFTIPEEIRKIDDFFLKIAKLQIDAEVLKSDSKGFDELKDLNGQRKLLKQLQGFIGAPIVKDSKKDDPDIDYLKQKNSTTKIDGDPIEDTILKKNVNYLVIRDYLIINSINITAYKNYISTLTNGINEYKAYIAKEKIDKTKIKGKDDVKDYDIALSNELMESFLDNPLFYVDGTTKNSNSIEAKKLSEILNFMGFPLLQLSLTKDYEGSDNNTTFDIKEYNKQKNEKDFYSSTLSADTNVFVVDFRKQRALLQNLIQTLDKAVIQKEKKVSEEINTELTNKFSEIGGKKTEFGPTIENCFRILANNTQALTATVYEITRKSVSVNFNTRNDILNENSYDTDIPKHIREKSSVAWPSVYRNNGDGSQTEIYLGEISGTEGVFPERDYIDKIFNALVSKQKSFKDITRSSATKNGLDTDNWFPINPLDYRDNPFLRLNTEQSIVEILDILANRFILRTAVLKNYSLFDSKTGLLDFSNYVAIDAINANLTIFNKDVRSILVEQLKDKVGFYENLKNTKFFKDNITEAAGNLTIQGTTDNPIEIGNVKIGGLADENVDYIDFDTDGIINNSQTLWTDIKNNPHYKKLISSSNTSVNKNEQDGPFLEQKYKNSNLNSNILYNVWDDEVGKRLYNDNDKNQSSLNITNINSVNISGSTADGKGKYLNKTNFIKPSDSEIQYSGIMTDSVLYKSQISVNAKALLLLSTIPFKPFKEAVLDVVFGGDYKGARILSLPKYYIYLIGGYLWRLGGGDLVFNGNNTDFETPRTEYLTKLGYLASSTKPIELEPELKNLPLSTKEKLIKEFEDWVITAVRDNGSGTFETAMDQYYSVDPIKSKPAADGLMMELKSATKMIIFAPKIFAKNDAGKLPERLSVTEAEVKSYISYFANNFTKTNSGNDTDKSKDEDVNEDKNFKIKLSIYNYFKNINDKWVSDIPNSFSVCGDNSNNGENGKDLIDYFKFIDRGWRDIGDEAVFNLNSFLNLGNEFKTSIYLFMSKLLRDSNFLFQILPTYIDFQTAEGVKKIFQPVTTLEGNASSGPIYACIYVGGASRVLDIQERDYGFKNDSFSFDDKILPSDFSEEEKAKKKKNSQVAFRVAFGAENQSIFKNVSLNQQEHKETGEYFKALSDLVDKRGGTQKTYQGTDLYKLFNTRSYTCKVDALGCMNIQPLMYFDLQNVPFFKGAYLITSVNHSITPNHMSTSFQGVRQSKFIAPPPKEITADLKIDFSETTDVSNPFILDKTSTIGKYVIGVETPDGEFDFDKFSVTNFVNKFKVPSAVATESNLTIFKTKCISNGIKSNKQVCMFLANILTVSNNMANFEEPNVISVDNKPLSFEDGTIYSGKTRHYGTNPPPQSSPFYDTYKDTTQSSMSAITPTFTSTTNANTVVIDIEQDGEVGVGNLFVGDKWLFRPRGYLYVTGRKEYFKYKSTKSLFTRPWDVSLFPDTAFGIAVDVWKNKRKDDKEGTYENKTAFKICEEGKGGADIYTRTFTIVGNETEIDLYFQKFENVLLAFNLKKDFQLD